MQAHNGLGLEDPCRLRVSTSTMSRAIKRVGWTRKKRRWVELPDERKNEPERRERMKQRDAKRLVVVDESGSNIA